MLGLDKILREAEDLAEIHRGQPALDGLSIQGLWNARTKAPGLVLSWRGLEIDRGEVAYMVDSWRIHYKGETVYTPTLEETAEAMLLFEESGWEAVLEKFSIRG